MALSKHFALFVSALLLVSQAICQDHENIRQVAQFPFNDWNSAEALAIYGDLLFVVDAEIMPLIFISLFIGDLLICKVH